MSTSSDPELVAPLSLTEQVSATRSGELPLQDLIAQTLERLELVNPSVRAILPDPRLRERLSSEAADIIDRWPTPSLRPPLFGAMVAVKDIFNVSRMPTRAGSAVPPESFSGREADVVARLREERMFDSVAALREQIDLDCAAAREALRAPMASPSRRPRSAKP